MTTQMRNYGGAAAGLVAGVLLMSFSGFGGLLARDSEQSPNAIMACAPDERLLTRQLVQNGQLQTIAECVPAASIQTAGIRNAASAPRATASSARSVARAQEPDAPERSWKKSALVIGGSAGAGAGIGGAINGGKGALIGAAIGGGAAAIYEAIKRKD